MKRIATAVATIRKWHGQPAAVQPGSVMERLDAATDPYQVSHAVLSAQARAFDHLDSLDKAMSTVGLHAWSPFTVLRGALENAAVACWLVSADHENVIIRRRLKLQAADIANRSSFLTSFRDFYATQGRQGEQWAEEAGHDLARSEEIRNKLESRGLAAGVASSDLRGRPLGWERILRDLAELPLFTDDLLPPYPVWQLFSGLAHGRTWASLAGLEKTESGRDQGVVHLRMTADESTLLIGIGTIFVLWREGRRRFDRLRLRMREHSAT